MILTTSAAKATTGWEAILFSSLLASALLVFGYRVYRLSKGGPMADVVGGAVLAVMLIAIAIGHDQGVEWARWPAFVYAVLFGLVAMPIWTLGVYLPSRPGPLDHAVIALYWISLILIGISALLV